MTALDMNRLPNLTTAQRDAVASPEVGDQIWNTSEGRIEVWDGAAWNPVANGVAPAWAGVLDYIEAIGSTGTVANPATVDLGTFTVPVDGAYILQLSATAVTGDAWIRVGTNPGDSDVFDGSAETRITPTSLLERYVVVLEAGVTYHVTAGAGGAGDVTEVGYTLTSADVIDETDDAGFLGTVNDEAELDSLAPVAKDWIHVPADFLVGGVTTFDAGDYHYDGTSWELIKEPIDPLALNEYIHNLKDFHVGFVYENGGAVVPVEINGVPATFQNLSNAVDNGDGSVTLSGGGGNSVFDKYASTVENVCKVGETIQFTVNAVGQFSTLMAAINDTPGTPANAATEGWRLVCTGANATLQFDGTALATSTPENGVYLFERTLAGWKVYKNGVVFYESTPECKNYNTLTAATASATGSYRVGNRHAAETAIANDNSTNIVTGHDLTQAGELSMKMLFKDANDGNSWQQVEIDVAELLRRAANDSAQDMSITLFSNSYVRVNVVDAATGELQFLDAVRDFSYLWSELWVIAEETDTLLQVQNVGTVNTTTTYENLGDPDPAFTGDDGAAIIVEYALGDRESYTFLDGIAAGGRSTGADARIHEFQVVNGQVQVRHQVASSGIVAAWYRHPDRTTSVDLRTKGNRFSATVDNALVQSSTIDDMDFENFEDLIGGALATYDGVNLVVAESAHDIEVTAMIFTTGTGSAQRLMYWAGDGTSVRVGAAGELANSGYGQFGQASPVIPAVLVIPAAETPFTTQLKSLSSGNNQIVERGSYIDVKAVQ